MDLILAPLTMLNKIGEDIYSALKGTVSYGASKLVSELEIGLTRYLSDKYARLSKTKTLLSPLTPISLEDIFVEPSFSSRDSKSEFQSIYELLNRERLICFSAIAGQGKSSLAKYLFCSLCRVNHGLIPVFVELRDLDGPQPDLEAFALSELRSSSTFITAEVFANLQKSGRFVYILDGYDEIKPDLRGLIARNIVGLSRKYDQLKMILTSRPTPDFTGWHDLFNYTIDPFDERKMRSLIDRSPISDTIKTQFLEKLNDLLETHLPFLENPLLLNMTIRTFMSGGEIPEKMHLFYRKAFETLRKDHDDMKFMYTRSYHSGLAEDDFIRLWRAFCFFSYNENTYKFSNDEIKKFIDKSVRFCDFSCSADKILMDFVESVSLIIKDGDEYYFLHRSFQEYFSAVFLRNEELKDKWSLVEHFVYRDDDEEVIPLMFSIDPIYLEETYLEKKLQEVIGEIEATVNVYDALSLFYLGLTLTPIGGEGTLDISFLINKGDGTPKHWAFWYLLRRIYKRWHEPDLIADLRKVSPNVKRRYTFEFGERDERSKKKLVIFARLRDDILSFMIRTKNDISQRRERRNAVLSLVR